MNRTWVVSYHLAGTVALLVLLSILSYAVWFPGHFWRGQGMHELMPVVWAVQLGLGPLLMLVLYRPGKRGVKFDLGFIALMQAATLSVSVWAIHQARPVFIVYSVDRFEVVQPSDVNLEGAVHAAYAGLPLTSPLFAVAELPSDPQERSDLLMASLEGAGDVHNFSRYYRPYVAPQTDAVIRRARPLEQLSDRDDQARHAIVEVLGPNVDLKRLRFVPYRMRKVDMSAVIDPVDARVVDVVPVTPW